MSYMEGVALLCTGVTLLTAGYVTVLGGVSLWRDLLGLK